MVNGIRTIYSRRLNKGFRSRFFEGSLVQHEKPEEGRTTHGPKRCKYNNKEKDNSPNTLNDKKK